MENKENNKEKYIIPNTLGIVGVAGSGKTTILTKCVSKIKAEKQVRVISLQRESDLAWKNKDAREVNINKHFGKDDDNSDAIELKNVSWQNIVFTDNFFEYHSKATEILSQKIIEFAEKSTIPCVLIVEEIWAYRPDQAMHLMQIFDALSKINGYFLFTTRVPEVPDDNSVSFLDKVDKIVDLRMHRVPFKEDRAIDFKIWKDKTIEIKVEANKDNHRLQMIFMEAIAKVTIDK